MYNTTLDKKTGSNRCCNSILPCYFQCNLEIPQLFFLPINSTPFSSSLHPHRWKLMDSTSLNYFSMHSIKCEEKMLPNPQTMSPPQTCFLVFFFKFQKKSINKKEKNSKREKRTGHFRVFLQKTHFELSTGKMSN